VGAQPSPSGAEGRVLAQFDAARSVAVDPRGRLYVSDAGSDAVYVLTPDGTEQMALGGTGTQTGAFDDPADVDPTNGQTVVVADAGNGRLQRFSEEGQFLEALPVASARVGSTDRRAFDDGRDGSTVRGDGRPIAVASTAGEQIYAIDDRAGTVLRWDEQRRLERVVGGAVQRRGRLEGPRALALTNDRRLYVADSVQEAVFAYDAFGTFVRRLPTPALPEVRALAVRGNRLWIVCADRVFVWNRSTRRLAEHAVTMPAPLVDVAPHADGLYVLTATRLWARPAL